MKLNFLGTGAGVPSRLRNTSSLALSFPESKRGIWLFDCGEATQHQILTSSIKLSRIERIFITHLHGDHIFGLPGVLGSRSFQGGKTPLTLYGPKGIKRYIEVSLETSQTYLQYPLQVVELEDEREWEIDDFSIQAKPLDHRILSYGYRIEQSDLPGELKLDQLKQLGIPPGPIYGKLKKGESVRLENGQLLHGTDFLGPSKRGKKIAIFGDTRITPYSPEVAEGVDVLVHEATFRADQEDLAEAYFHSTSVQTAKLARQAQVGTLILNHISPRFHEEECVELLDEAKAIFPQTFLAYDGWEYEMKLGLRSYFNNEDQKKRGSIVALFNRNTADPTLEEH